MTLPRDGNIIPFTPRAVAAGRPWPWEKLKLFGYNLIVADPPWFFEAWTLDGHNTKGAGGQYDLMRLEDIMALPVGELAAGDCLLLLWTTGWGMATGQAQKVARAWGFDPVTEIVWHKTTEMGKTRMGTGYRSRSMHEPILLCTTGNPRHAPLPSYFAGVAREHSRKPDEFYKMLDRYCPNLNQRADLFSRESREGFDGWGKEFGKFDAALTGSAESAQQPISPSTEGEAYPSGGTDGEDPRHGAPDGQNGSLFDVISPT